MTYVYRQAQHRPARPRWVPSGPTPTAWKWIFHGASLTAGNQGGGTTITTVLSTLRPSDTIVNQGHSSGVQTSDLVAEFASVIAPLYDPGKNNVIFFWDGALNTIDFNTPPFGAQNASAAGALSEANGYADLAHSYGFKVHAVTVLPAIDGELDPITFPAMLRDYNDLLRANYSHFDGLVNPATDPKFNTNDTSIYFDDGTTARVHLTAAGYTYVATTWLNPYMTLLAAGTVPTLLPVFGSGGAARSTLLRL
jgi:hypothetical protein